MAVSFSDTESGVSDTSRVSSPRSAILSAAIFAACILISWPISNIPWGDDFSYTRTALEFARTGHITYNGWAAPLGGWQILWGALFIKLFGFSFTVVQLSTIPLAVAAIYLFHRILQRFGMSSREALFGSLTLGLTPLFLQMATSYMTDVPGLLAVLLCVWMCQNAASAQDDRTARKWIILAALTNIVAGSVRQTSWLGALVMIPSTAWMLRRWKWMVPTAAVLWLISLGSILLCIHWFNHQPYAVPEPFSFEFTKKSLKDLALHLLRTGLCLILLLFPIVVAWIPTARRLDKTARIVAGAALSSIVVALTVLAYHHKMQDWALPWLVPFLDQDMRLIPMWLKYALSVVVVLTGVFVVAQLASEARCDLVQGGRWTKQTSEMFWILGPFTLSYIGILLSRAEMAIIQDRYLLVLAPPVIAFLLLAHRKWVAPGIPPVSVALLVIYGLTAVAWNHDNFANARATKTAMDQMLARGVSQTSIQAGLGIDGWTQLQYHGFINEEKIGSPKDAWDPTPLNWDLPDRCNYATDWISYYTPVIRPRYFISEFPRECPGSLINPGKGYRAWMPPFNRMVWVQTLPPLHKSLRNHK